MNLRFLSIAFILVLIPLHVFADKGFDTLKVQAESGDASAQFNLGAMYYKGEGVAKDLTKAMEWFRKAAEQGYAKAQNGLGYIYDEREDYANAMEWFRKAANQGYALAQGSLGDMYLRGHGVAKDSSKAIEWFSRAADQGYARAQNSLGYIYGDRGDYAKSMEWFRKAADQGYATPQCNLGFMYYQGQGVARNYATAMEWFRKAAEQGDVTAQHYLGEMYKKGEGVSKDYPKALEWYRKAAEQGHVRSQNSLGLMYKEREEALYADGQVVAKDYAQAMEWFRKAAEQGYAEAQNSLGYIYSDREDYAQAMEWYRKAAEQGYATAQGNLGYLYYREGVLKDYSKAVEWFRKAAEQGDAAAQHYLGDMYANGKGVAKDEAEAYKWWLVAGAQGFKYSKKSSDILERRITEVQRAKGQRLAREFKLQVNYPGGPTSSEALSPKTRPRSSGTGFFITDDGYFITNQHVADAGATVRLSLVSGLIAAKVVKVDKANDLSLLKAQGAFVALPLITSARVRLGATAFTVGFPNIELQGFTPKLAKGEIAGLAGAQDDARYFQISVPIQPGNSGGALVDESGNVIGVVAAKLSQKAAVTASGSFAENVNYAVKSSYVLSFLESVPEVSAKLKEPTIQTRKFEDVVRVVEQASVMVLVY